jgi:hypothetical protein
MAVAPSRAKMARSTFTAAPPNAQSAKRYLTRITSGRLKSALARVPATNPSCTASVSHAAVDASRCHSTLSRGATAETPNQSDMPRSSAMETRTSAFQRGSLTGPIMA